MKLKEINKIKFNKEIHNLKDIDSIELVIIVNEVNQKENKDISIFNVLECQNLEELNDLLFK